MLLHVLAKHFSYPIGEELMIKLLQDSQPWYNRTRKNNYIFIWPIPDNRGLACWPKGTHKNPAAYKYQKKHIIWCHKIFFTFFQ
jgi:hypothetical protein